MFDKAPDDNLERDVRLKYIMMTPSNWREIFNNYLHKSQQMIRFEVICHVVWKMTLELAASID